MIKKKTRKKHGNYGAIYIHTAPFTDLIFFPVESIFLVLQKSQELPGAHFRYFSSYYKTKFFSLFFYDLEGGPTMKYNFLRTSYLAQKMALIDIWYLKKEKKGLSSQTQKRSRKTYFLVFWDILKNNPYLRLKSALGRGLGMIAIFSGSHSFHRRCALTMLCLIQNMKRGLIPDPNSLKKNDIPRFLR